MSGERRVRVRVVSDTRPAPHPIAWEDDVSGTCGDDGWNRPRDPWDSCGAHIVAGLIGMLAAGLALSAARLLGWW